MKEVSAGLIQSKGVQGLARRLSAEQKSPGPAGFTAGVQRFGEEAERPVPQS